jgi:WD40 repeat protein
MPKKISLLLLFLALFTIFLPAQAQTESEIIGRAERLVRNIVPSVGNLSQWQYTGYVMTNDGALGCPLVTSYNLGYSVVPWRVSLTFTNGQTYVVYVSSDPNVSVVCDSKLLSPVSTATLISGPTCTASAVASRRGAIYTEPSSGVLLGYVDAYGTIPVIGRTIDTAWYQVTNTVLSGWVSLSDVYVTGAGCNAIPATSNFVTVTTEPTNYVGQGVGGPVSCFLSATYANIRTLPNLNGAIIEQVTSGQVYGVTGRTQGADWHEVFTRTRAGKGWVAISVSSIQGTGCAGLPITGVSDSTTSTPVNPIITNCPATYTGYLLPRLQVGARARVTNIIPVLRLRTVPQAVPDNSNVVLEIPTQEIMDVVSGPICETGTARIWWQVLYNGTYGWTAESDLQVTSGYYLEPLVTSPGRRFVNDATTSEIGRLQVGSPVYDMTFTPDGAQLLVVNGADTFVRPFDSATGNNLESAYLNNTGAPLTHVVAGENIITVDINALVSIWSYAGEKLADYQADILPIGNTQIALSPDGSELAIAACIGASLTGCTASALQVINLTDGSIQALSLPDTTITSIAYHPTEEKILIGARSGGLLVWDFVNTTPISIEAVSISEVAYNADGSRFAVAYCTGVAEEGLCNGVAIDLYDSATGSSLATLTGHSDIITTMQFSPDGSKLATGGLDNVVIVWDITNNKEFSRYTDYILGVNSLSFYPSGNLLVTGDNVGNVVLVNLE